MNKQIRNMAILIALWLAFDFFTFTVNETQTAVTLLFGKPIGEYTTAGLKFKMPWWSVVKLEKRFQKYDSDPKEALTKDNKALLVDIFSWFRICQPTTFIRNTQTMANAQHRVDDNVYSITKNELGKYEFSDIVVGRRATIMDTVTAICNEQLQRTLGLEAAFVKLNRVDYPKENRESVLQRMASERQREAERYRSEGRQDSLRITSDANRQVAEILGQAENLSLAIKGRGQARETMILNAAYTRDPEFFALLKGLDATQTIFSGTGPKRLVLTGDEPFLQAIFKGEQ